jgi:N-acetyl-gamma-glutamyl-phosphate/LysW-gamma-L-alpha-aminoadipyl-6-phosphate reductase
MGNIKVGIIGGSGYTGSELLRLLLQHPEVEVTVVTSRKQVGKFIHKTHPNLRGVTNLKFVSTENLSETDVLFLGLPHGTITSRIEEYTSMTNLLIDLSSDFRLRNPQDYVQYYRHNHERPDLLNKFVYGMPELYREKIKNSNLIAVPGCTATGAIIPLKPILDIFNVNQVVIDSKVGSSAAGAKSGAGTHHPERQGVVRSFKPTGHRHIAEMQQELNLNGAISMNFSPHAVELVRGIQSTIHVFMEDEYDEKTIWQTYLQAYKHEPFIRLVREQSGGYRFPDPKVVIGTNLCDIGFEKDSATGRLVIMSAIDNLVKGAAGQAVQCMNIALGFEETTGINQVGFHPI